MPDGSPPPKNVNTTKKISTIVDVPFCSSLFDVNTTKKISTIVDRTAALLCYVVNTTKKISTIVDRNAIFGKNGLSIRLKKFLLL